jgi:hypothetical protein
LTGNGQCYFFTGNATFTTPQNYHINQGSISTGSPIFRLYMPRSGVLRALTASCSVVVPSISVFLQVNGVSIVGLTLSGGTYTSQLISSPYLAGDYLTIFLAVVGASFTGYVTVCVAY